ncbi:hypothetical protein PbDSM24746_21650 [Paenibacillus macerans]|nr:hypothetical protein PbDSM24746_21650 [Paenibacillus macerans]GBK68470.1 hypothetical protein PbJCM17693_21780 [Paenibacillus macerans]
MMSRFAPGLFLVKGNARKMNGYFGILTQRGRTLDLESEGYLREKQLFGPARVAVTGSAVNHIVSRVKLFCGFLECRCAKQSGSP